MKLYLDLCVYNRPFDYQGQERIALETGAFIYLVEQIEKGNVDFLITCDDWMSDLYKRNAQAVKVVVMSILEFLAKEVK